MAYETASSPSRIQNNIKELQELAERVRASQRRVMGHARALGYFQDAPANKLTEAPTPIVNSLATALSDLDCAVDELSGSLNVFD